MTAVHEAAPDVRPMSIWKVGAAEAAGLVLLLATALLARIPFWQKQIECDDALNYYFGALSTHVAHPPGYVGYCVLGGLLNHLIGHIQVTFLLMTFCASMIASASLHFLAKSFGLRWPAALLTAATYTFSINTQTASLIASPHIIEGMFTIIFALLAREALRTRRPALAVAMTLIFALAGAFRPSTTMLLAPLWLYLVFRFAKNQQPMRAFALMVVQLVLAIAIIGSWSWANEHYTSKAGYGHKSFEVQALMPSVYEYAGLNAKVEIGQLRLTFHMPAVEFLAWIEVKTGWHLLPHMPGWPTPSIRRVGQLMLMQTVKEGWWFVLSAPCAALLPFFWLARRRWFSMPSGADCAFLILWIVPAVLFFILGHMGASTYLQIYLPAIYVATVYLLLGKWFGTGRKFQPTAASSNASDIISPNRGFAAPLGLICACTAASLLVFCFGRPFADNNGIRRLVNLMLLQHTGRCLRDGTGVSRFQAELVPSPKTQDDDYAHAKSDGDLLRIARRDHFSPIPVFPNEKGPPPP
jgi:hypothetical protein